MINMISLTACMICIYTANAFTMDVYMPGAIRNSNDDYLCASFPIPRSSESYIVSYDPTANSSISHHILLYGCSGSPSSQTYYTCGSICDDGKEKIIFAWANNAKKFEYPPDTGMAVGNKAGINYFVLQVHYLKASQIKDYSGFQIKLTDESPKYSVGIFLMFSYYGDIEPKKRKVHLDISCRYQGKTEAYTYAFRTHTHKLGRSVTGFKVSVADDQIELIGKANPQWPQTFYKASKVIIKPGDILMARCLFDSTGKDTVTSIGATHHDEMCNFFIMLISKNNGKNHFLNCGGDEYKDLWKNIPSYSMDYDAPNPSPDLILNKNSLINYEPNMEALKADEKWKVDYKLGEVSGLSILSNESPNSDYSLFVLHRGSHKWDQNSFIEDVYQGSQPISVDPILEVDFLTGKVLRQAGQNLFYLPHSITVTKDGKYIWITDVALHQVMRFNLRKDSKLIDDTPSIVLGEKFVRGNDKNHFCKPAKVAVDSRGNIFVADGYCNRRVVCFSSNGTFIDEWRVKDHMDIVHSLTIEEDVSGDFMKNVVWVADRENRRIVGFNYDGSIKSVLYSESLDLPIYAIEYYPGNQLIYGVGSNGNDKGNSFTFSTSTFLLGKSWNANYPLHAPHDLCLAENGTTIFVAELHLQKVIKFHLGGSLESNAILISSEFNKIPDLMKNMNPILIAVSLILVVALLVICVTLLKYFRRHKTSKIRRYGHSFKDKEGFRPLTQNDEGNDDADSDPETEEYSVPHGHPLRKQKA